MPRIQVRADHGGVVLDERITSSDFDGEHFRRCLADRVAWAVRDAEEVPPRDAPSAVTRALRAHRRPAMAA